MDAHRERSVEPMHEIVGEGEGCLRSVAVGMAWLGVFVAGAYVVTVFLRALFETILN
jgi:hypothetical protein